MFTVVAVSRWPTRLLVVADGDTATTQHGRHEVAQFVQTHALQAELVRSRPNRLVHTSDRRVLLNTNPSSGIRCPRFPGTVVPQNADSRWIRSRNGNVGMSGSELAQVAGVACCHDAASEPDRGSDDQGIDGHLASSPSGLRASGQRFVPGALRWSPPGRTSRQDMVGRFVDASAAIQLDKHRRRDPDRRVTRVRAAHDGPHPLVADLIDLWASEG